MAVTKQQIVESALGALGIYGPGNAVSQDDLSFSLSELNGLLESLAGVGLTITVTTDPDDALSTVDGKFLNGLRDLLRFTVSPAFNASQDPNVYAFAMGELRSQLETPHDFVPVVFTDY